MRKFCPGNKKIIISLVFGTDLIIFGPCAKMNRYMVHKGAHSLEVLCVSMLLYQINTQKVLTMEF